MWNVYDVDLRGCFGRTLPLHEVFLLLFYAYVVICNFGRFIYYYMYVILWLVLRLFVIFGLRGCVGIGCSCKPKITYIE